MKKLSRTNKCKLRSPAAEMRRGIFYLNETRRTDSEREFGCNSGCNRKIFCGIYEYLIQDRARKR